MKLKHLVFCLVLSGVTKAQTTSTITIQPKSTFRLSGSSNVNHFDCELSNGFVGEKVSYCFNKIDNNITFEKTIFKLGVRFFDCGNRLISRDLRETLKEEEYPDMKFELLHTNFTLAPDCSPTVTTLITIAGKTNRYNLPYHLVDIDDSTYTFQLNANFKMSDFDIAPPTTMMGLIKVDDQISIEMILAFTL